MFNHDLHSKPSHTPLYPHQHERHGEFGLCRTLAADPIIVYTNTMQIPHDWFHVARYHGLSAYIIDLRVRAANQAAARALSLPPSAGYKREHKHAAVIAAYHPARDAHRASQVDTPRSGAWCIPTRNA